MLLQHPITSGQPRPMQTGASRGRLRLPQTSADRHPCNMPERLGYDAIDDTMLQAPQSHRTLLAIARRSALAPAGFASLSEGLSAPSASRNGDGNPIMGWRAEEESVEMLLICFEGRAASSSVSRRHTGPSAWAALWSRTQTLLEGVISWRIWVPAAAAAAAEWHWRFAGSAPHALDPGGSPRSWHPGKGFKACRMM